MATPPRSRTRSLVQIASLVVGAVFLAVGVLGFIPGITTHYATLTFAGHDSGAPLVGLFNVSVLHNIVHLLFGVAGLALARTATSARLFLLGGGVIYLVLWIYGLLIDQHSMANFIPINTPGNWLHFVLGVGMIALGVLLPRLDTRTRTSTPTRPPREPTMKTGAMACRCPVG